VQSKTTGDLVVEQAIDAAAHVTIHFSVIYLTAIQFIVLEKVTAINKHTRKQDGGGHAG
jgi:hypothetical protein